MTIERAEQDSLLRLATAVVDNDAVDWEREAATDRGVRHKMHNLRLIQSIGNAHREVRDEILAVTQTFESPRNRSWGKLRLIQRLGNGSFGEVYRAWDPDLQSEVALKLPSTTAIPSSHQRRQFLHEAQKLARVRHAHVLRVLGADTHDGRVGIWTELVDGRTLEELLRHTGRFSAAEATWIGIELCRALAAVHSAGILHRDVKTANVLREEGGRIVLLDFSTAADRLPPLDADDKQMPISGTPRFMAPEQFHNKPASVRSDLYSLGVLLYRLVTVKYPLEATTLNELVESHRSGTAIVPLIDRRPELSGPFVQVVERMLAADPAQRFASAGETERALEATRTTPAAPVPVPVKRVPETPPHFRWWLSVAVVLVVLLFFGVVNRDRFFVDSLNVEAVFYALADGQPKRALQPLSLVGMNDDVFLELKTTRAAHVYVLNYDEKGTLLTMFPLRGSELSNPLAANRSYRLPDTTEVWSLSIAGEVETVFVVAADEPLAAIEELIDRIPQSRDEPVVVEPEMLLRGFGRVRERSDAAPERSELERLSEELKELAESDPGIWVETFYFRSPS